MKKSFLALGLIGLVGLLQGCGGTPKQECYFPDAPKQEAPLWVCGAPVDGVNISAVGYTQKSGAGIGFMRQMAATDARVQLAQMVRVQVQNRIRQYAETTGTADAETVDQVASNVTQQITNESLSGSRIYRVQQSPKGGLFVLVGIDEKNAEAITKAAVKTSMNNEKALWQKFNAKKAFDEMATDIAKQQ